MSQMLQFPNALPFRGFAQGRLTTETGVAISTSDRTAQGTVYYTPFNGNLISLYDGSQWQLYEFSEFSIAFSSDLTSGNNYDLFVYDNSGTLTLELSAAWTNDTTRADAITTQDGISVKSGATTRRLVGTIRASATDDVEDSAVKRYVWNLQNKVPRGLNKPGDAASWTYNSATIRQANADTDHKVEVVVGDAVSYLDLTVFTLVVPGSGGGGLIGIGEDTTTAFDSDCLRNQTNATSSSTGILKRAVPLGYHAYNWNESALGAPVVSTFFGDDAGGTGNKCGLVGSILA